MRSSTLTAFVAGLIAATMAMPTPATHSIKDLADTYALLEARGDGNLISGQGAEGHRASVQARDNGGRPRRRAPVDSGAYSAAIEARDEGRIRILARQGSGISAPIEARTAKHDPTLDKVLQVEAPKIHTRDDQNQQKREARSNCEYVSCGTPGHNEECCPRNSA